MKKSILIVGSAGFIGHALAGRLASRGWAVTGFDKRPHALPGGSTVVVGDVRVPADVARAIDAAGPVEAIVHGGGVSGSMVLRDDPAAIAGINIGGTVTVLEEARRRQVGTVIFCSSIMAYGPTVPGPVEETAPLVPANVYGATKAAGEALVHSYAAEFGLRAVQLRIAHVYGPDRATACPLREMVAASLTGRPARIAAPEATPRQFIHVDDVLSAIEAALAWRGEGSPALNIAPGGTLTLGGVADTVRRILGRLDVTFADQEVSPDYRTGTLAIGRAAALLGWAPQVTLETGIGRFAEALRAAPAGQGSEA